MKVVITGNETVARAAACARVEVVSAYPITPQSPIVEELANLMASGSYKGKYIHVESEHSAMAGCISASLAGARTFTATSAQGLALMHEMLHWAAACRTPVVLANVNRAMAPGWSIWTDQNDSLSQRDTGLLQFYCEDNQEVFDTTVQAFKIAETLLLPVMVVLDAFVLSHTAEAVDIPPQEEIDKFLPPFNPPFKLDVKKPHCWGGLMTPDIYQEFRFNMQKAMDDSINVIKKVDDDWFKFTGRKYGLVELYPKNDAKNIIVASSTIASTTRYVVDKLRAEGLDIALLKVRTFRPFPSKEIASIISNLGVKKIAVFDRNISFGHHGIFAQEIKSALYNLDGKKPVLYGFIGGLGGRDVSPEAIEDVIKKTLQGEARVDEINWVGLKY